MHWQDATQQSKFKIAYRGTVEKKLMARHADGSAIVATHAKEPPIFRPAFPGEAEGFNDWKPAESFPSWIL